MELLRRSCWRSCWTRPKSAQEEVLRPFPAQGREPVEELVAASRNGFRLVTSSHSLADRLLQTLSSSLAVLPFLLSLPTPRCAPVEGGPAALWSEGSVAATVPALVAVAAGLGRLLAEARQALAEAQKRAAAAQRRAAAVLVRLCPMLCGLLVSCLLVARSSDLLLFRAPRRRLPREKIPLRLPLPSLGERVGRQERLSHAQRSARECCERGRARRAP